MKEKEFNQWINQVNEQMKTHGLNIDETTIEEPGHFVPFLDIQYCFENGKLQTDLYTKPTDSRVYLH